MAGSSESRTLVLLALVANVLIAIMKFVAAVVTGSAAMLAEGFHSTADSGNQLFLLRGAAVSRYAPSVKHQFGRGKELYFWSLMVAVFLFVGGAVVSFYEGLERFRHPEETTNLAWSLSVLAAAAVFEIVIAFWPALKEFNRRRGSRNWWRSLRESKDPALMVVLFEDTAAVLGVFIAAGGILLGEWTGNPRWDGAASMAIGVLLALVAFLVVAVSGCSIRYSQPADEPVVKEGKKDDDSRGGGDGKKDKDDKGGPPPHAHGLLKIPRGHLPGPGKCRIWVPGTPPGKQRKAGDCNKLASEVPAGAWLVYRHSHDIDRIEITIYDEKHAGLIVEVQVFDMVTGEFLGHDEHSARK